MSFYSKGNFVVLWFPAVLVVTVLSAELLFHAACRPFILTILISSLLLSYCNQGFQYIDFPLSLAVALHTVPIFFIGFFAAQKTISLSKIMSFILLGPLILAQFFPALKYDLWKGELGLPLLSLANAAAITAGLAATLKTISNKKTLNLLRLLGKSSLPIMFFHQPIQIALLNGGMTNIWLRFSITLILCAMLALAIEKQHWLQLLLLGKSGPKKK
jgi:fucose 4-O-acetylase-like acetyltransferase